MGSSPEVVLERGRRRDGLAVARSFSAPIWPVVAIFGGPPIEGRAKRSRRTLVKVLLQAEKLGERWLGAAAMGFELYSCDGEMLQGGGRRLGAPIYRPRSPARVEQCPE
jgi:hypothetical protein